MVLEVPEDDDELSLDDDEGGIPFKVAASYYDACSSAMEKKSLS
jgi:hypothetical protein